MKERKTNYEFYFSENSIIRPTFNEIPTEKWSGIVPDFFKSSMKYRLAWTSAVAVEKKVFDVQSHKLCFRGGNIAVQV